MKIEKLGFYIDSSKTFYMFEDNTSGLNGIISQNIDIEQLEKVLLARDLDGLNKLSMSGATLSRADVQSASPRLMKLSEAKTKGFEIVTIPRNEVDAKRINKKKEQISGAKDGFFGKQNKS